MSEPPPEQTTVTQHLPVHGYRDQTDEAIALVNDNKIAEEIILRKLDTLFADDEHKYDKRWLAIAKTHIETGFMALNRAILQPQRVELPEDANVEAA